MYEQIIIDAEPYRLEAWTRVSLNANLEIRMTYLAVDETTSVLMKEKDGASREEIQEVVRGFAEKRVEQMSTYREVLGKELERLGQERDRWRCSRAASI